MRRPTRALVLAGGGARGAYEAGVIAYLLGELPRRLGRAPKLDLLLGTSVGAIHACFLAAACASASTSSTRKEHDLHPNSSAVVHRQSPIVYHANGRLLIITLTVSYS